jgi:ferredoxin--NADP+ reductase
MYSIASHRKGDDGDSTTVTLCIKRVNFINAEGEHIVGLASNFMCDLKPGESVNMIGPTGRRFILPKDQKTDIIMIAVGTGIAPFRAFVKYLFDREISVTNRVRLFYGVKTGMEALYMNDENDDIGQYLNQETFRAFKALSDIGEGEEDKGLVQHRIKENINDVWEIIEEGNFSVYICGLKVMAKEVDNVLREEAEKHGYDWDLLLKEFKAAGRWNVEVY